MTTNPFLTADPLRYGQIASRAGQVAVSESLEHSLAAIPNLVQEIFGFGRE